MKYSHKQCETLDPDPFTRTRRKGHMGDHIARGEEGNFIRRWPKKEAISREDCDFCHGDGYETDPSER